MSGIEVIGLLASAAQLAFYTINISDLISEIYHRVQNAPKRIQEHIQQIGQLISTARLIEKHELLQTDNINAHIISTLHQAKLLSATLDKVKGEYLQRSPLRRYWKLIKGGTEREILAHFERLEKEKSSLLLCISIVHTDLLGNIRGNLDLSTDRSSVSMPSDKKASAQGASLENAKRPKQKGFNDKPRSVPVTSPANAEGGNKDSIKNHRLSESPSIQGGEIVRAERASSRRSRHHTVPQSSVKITCGHPDDQCSHPAHGPNNSNAKDQAFVSKEFDQNFEGNISKADSQQIVGNIVRDSDRESKKQNFRDNTSEGTSLQTVGNMDHGSYTATCKIRSERVPKDK